MKDTLASNLLQGGKLSIGVLIVSQNPHTAAVHKAVLSLVSGTTKPLIGQGRETVSKILIFGTPANWTDRFDVMDGHPVIAIASPSVGHQP